MMVCGMDVPPSMHTCTEMAHYKRRSYGKTDIALHYTIKNGVDLYSK